MAEQNRYYPTRGLCKGEVHVYGPDCMRHRYESQRRFGLSPSPLLDVGWRAWLDGQLRAKALEAERVTVAASYRAASPR